jgi:hypothetical protein
VRRLAERRVALPLEDVVEVAERLALGIIST